MSQTGWCGRKTTLASLSTTLFQQIPYEIWSDQIFQFMGGKWLFGIGRLVCREWNDIIIHDLLFIKLHITLNHYMYEDESKRVLQACITSLVKTCLRKSFVGVKDLTFSGLYYLPYYETNQSRNYFEINGDQKRFKMIPVEVVENGTFTKIDPMNFNPFEYFPQLTLLNIRENFLDWNACKHLANCERLQNLTCLNISNNNISDEGLSQLSAGTTLTKLVALDLSGNSISSLSIEKFRCSSIFSQLTELDVSFNNLKDQGVNLLLCHNNSNNWPNLTKLVMCRISMTCEGARAIANSPVLKQIKYLSLSFNSIQDEGLQALSNSNHFASPSLLTHLDLVGNGITNSELFNSQNFSNLTELTLLANSITNHKASHISEYLQKLKSFRY
ncbi:hypothetical protein C9374_006623 [Naegleria lovaniensis]|uniref:Uncharacterized protein n=1 Tax=Naegleria lovaniensis TaxID=51637 RepID=A0AA88GN83_NAELO|nr:uncharacterized protein C9374_006623 [Naegleria lovaniensis]KAG2379506.1 hypothetical protein C9374_006623 [Naegleria lovaniensis]